MSSTTYCNDCKFLHGNKEQLWYCCACICHRDLRSTNQPQCSLNHAKLYWENHNYCSECKTELFR